MKNSIYYFVSGLIAVLFGVFIILNPNAVVNIAAFLFSVVLLIKGLRTLFNSIRFDSVSSKVSVNGVEINVDSKKRVRKTMYINALISVTVGLVALIISIIAMVNKTSSIMKIVVYIVASGFLFSGITGILENRRIKKFYRKHKKKHRKQLTNRYYRNRFKIYLGCSRRGNRRNISRRITR